jgi:hypothetical protein
MCEDPLVAFVWARLRQARRTACNWRNQPAGSVAGLVFPSLLFHRVCGGSAAASLLLALLQIGAQLGGQSRATDFRLRARLLHGFGPLHHGHGCPDKTFKPHESTLRAPHAAHKSRAAKVKLPPLPAYAISAPYAQGLLIGHRRPAAVAQW